MTVVSVPLRGLWFLSLVKMDVINHFFRLGFRPLAGIMVLIVCRSYHVFRWDSFRPLAGIMVLILHGVQSEHKGMKMVSVPLRGLWFLSSGEQIQVIIMRQMKFPSPCGDYGSYLSFMENKKKAIIVCFRPLAGIMVLIINLAKNVYISASLGFRPLAGIMVLIPSSFQSWDVSVPLRGLWFLSSQMIDVLTKIYKEFPSPCGDYGSYQMMPTSRILRIMFPSPCGDYGSYQYRGTVEP